MNIQKILWPTDLSENAGNALGYVNSLTRQYGAEVHVLHVMEDVTDHAGWYGEFGEEHIGKIVEWERKKAEERLAAICSDHLDGCPMFVRHVAVGDPADVILKIAGETGADMLVMATRGKKGRFDFGSVADRVVKNSPVPVVTVPPRAEMDCHPAAGSA